MKATDVRLNLYSFGYGAGFLSAGRHPGTHGHVDLAVGARFVTAHNLAGLEFPFDFFFRNSFEQGLNFLDTLKGSTYLDFETFDVNQLRNLIPEFKARGMSSVRVKMNHLGPVFYGGNRYSSLHFKTSLETFEKELREIVPVLRDLRFKVLIENHQDLSSVDLERLVDRVGRDCVGINWDIGNSLAVGDTVESFWARLGSAVENVHLKDYKISWNESGFKLVRCALGSGVVNFRDIFSKFQKNGIHSTSIELGAQISRQCDVFVDGYWDALGDSAPMSRDTFIAAVKCLPTSDASQTRYEAGATPEEICDRELREFSESVAHLKSIEVL